MTIRLVCLDIDGTLTDGVAGPALPGASEALRRLRRAWPVRLVTNATSRSHRSLVAALIREGFQVEPLEVVTPAATARRVLPARGHARGILLVEPEARIDYSWFEEIDAGPAVLVATEAHGFQIAELQPAFRALLAGAALYTLQKNRTFRKAGQLVTDLGPLAAFFEYAAQCQAENLGKPSPLLFDALAAELGIERGQMLMVGDDAEFDAAGAERLGIHGVVVRTGKYREGDETRVSPPPSAVIGSVSELPEWLEALSATEPRG